MGPIPACAEQLDPFLWGPVTQRTLLRSAKYWSPPNPPIHRGWVALWITRDSLSHLSPKKAQVAASKMTKSQIKVGEAPGASAVRACRTR